MAAIFAFKTHERRAFIISVAAHALLFLLLILFAGRNLGNPLEVRLVIERENTTLQKLETPEEEEEETPKQKRRRETRKESSSQARPSRDKNAKSEKSAPATPSDPWSSYERQMHKRDKSAASSSAPTSKQTAWGNEKTGKTAKHGENEAVVVPKGTTGTSTRWKKGASRRLVSLPTIDYPESVRKKSGQGRVELLIEVGPDGRVEEIEVLKSSGYAKLDINAKNAYRNAVFSPSPSGESATGIVIVTFRMRDN
jgi:TonB family protein